MNSSDNESSSIFPEDYNASSNFPCFKQPTRSPTANFAYYVNVYAFPVIFAVGVTGNVLNLLVFNSRGMKSKANYLLSAMAVADFAFFLCMFVINSSFYDRLNNSEEFMKFYYKSKMTFTTLVNWFSSASIWFAVMVTVERLVAIRTPLRARYLWRRWRIALVIGFVFGFSLLLQLYNFAWLRPMAMHCNDTNKTLYVLQQIRITDNVYLYKFVKISQVAGPVVTVTVPLIMLVALNGLLSYYLKRSVREAARLYPAGSSSKSSEKENKVTTTVLVIVVAFFVFNFPSAVVYVWAVAHPSPRELVGYSLFANYMVTLNKAMNFWLYCLSSESFRKKLALLCGKATEPRSVFSVQSPSGSFSTTRRNRHGVRAADEDNNNCRRLLAETTTEIR